MPSAGHYTHSLTHLTTAVKTDKVTARKLHIFFLFFPAILLINLVIFLLFIPSFFRLLQSIIHECGFLFFFFVRQHSFLSLFFLASFLPRGFYQPGRINLKEKEADITFLSNAAEVFQMVSSRNILSHISTHARTCSARANHVQSISHTFQPHAGCPCDPSLDPHHMLYPRPQ